MTIAILENEQEEINRIQGMIFDIQGDYRIEHFLNGKALIEAIEKEDKTFDLLFCDIFMEEENGMDIAREVKRVSPQTAIAFITCSRDHAVEAFSMNAIHYLMKPVQQKDIIEVFRRLEKKTEPRSVLAILINKTMNILYQDEIIRIESHGHNTIIICTNNIVYSLRKPFYELNDMLDASFIQIKKGLTLNMHHITRMTFRECVTRDGLTYLLRRDQAKEIRDRYYSFVRQELIP